MTDESLEGDVAAVCNRSHTAAADRRRIDFERGSTSNADRHESSRMQPTLALH
jgi:hypothetical protein